MLGAILGGVGKALGGALGGLKGGGDGGGKGGLLGGLAKAGISALGSLGKKKAASGGGAMSEIPSPNASSLSSGGDAMPARRIAKRKAASSRSFSGTR
jgi:hypothetical protein